MRSRKKKGDNTFNLHRKSPYKSNINLAPIERRRGLSKSMYKSKKKRASNRERFTRSLPIYPTPKRRAITATSSKRLKPIPDWLKGKSSSLSSAGLLSMKEDRFTPMIEMKVEAPMLTIPPVLTKSIKYEANERLIEVDCAQHQGIL